MSNNIPVCPRCGTPFKVSYPPKVDNQFEVRISCECDETTLGHDGETLGQAVARLIKSKGADV
jgi:hypothetical protein